MANKINDEFDDMVDKATASGSKKAKSKQTTLTIFHPVKGSIQANPWNEEDVDDISDFDKSDVEMEVVQSKAKPSRLVNTGSAKGYAEVSLA